MKTHLRSPRSSNSIQPTRPYQTKQPLKLQIPKGTPAPFGNLAKWLQTAVPSAGTLQEYHQFRGPNPVVFVNTAENEIEFKYAPSDSSGLAMRMIIRLLNHQSALNFDVDTGEGHLGLNMTFDFSSQKVWRLGDIEPLGKWLADLNTNHPDDPLLSKMEVLATDLIFYNSTTP